LQTAAVGEEIVLSRAARPVARLMPLEEQTPRQPGLLKHWQITEICSSSRRKRRICGLPKG
jgi:antitoxin (DNA-binding transcriptional repressor) of toxin-antitoxin stability system